jgi:sec-independent protein translocase protein TatC
MNETGLMMAGGTQDEAVLPLMAHLQELRKCLLLSLAVVALLGLAAYWYIDPILAAVARPVGKLYFLSPMEAFLSKLKFSFFIGLFLGAPFVFHQVWSFVQKGLLRREKQVVLALTGISALLFLAGAAFCWFVVLPASVRFLMGYGSPVLLPFISVTQYLSFVSRMVFSFGLVFELPLGIWFLVRTGLVSSGALRRNRRLVIVLSLQRRQC